MTDSPNTPEENALPDDPVPAGERPPRFAFPGHAADANPLDRMDTTEAVRSPDPAGDQKISDTFQRSLKESTKKKRLELFKGTGKRATFDVQLDRHEAKYIVPIDILPEVREFIRPFCAPDANGKGSPPQYTINTLQLDSPDLALHYAKYHESINRFKLRVRTYGEPGTSKVFLEVKRKINQTIVKSRTSIPFEAWQRDLLYDKDVKLDFRSTKEEEGFLDFARLTRQLGAVPTVWLRYVRESYFSRIDSYARVSFDTKLVYQPAYDWDSWGRGSRWIILDSSLEQNHLYDYSGVILELKTLSDTPRWMIDLVMHFDLVRCGNCKYSNAIWAESIFRGTPDLPMYSTELFKHQY
ncbi:MAG: polyphosphate polymerase domain-containing protein [Kiritimatiellae bacterium]|nr:polyphosphate polymerase domain-containing protein [Kiritimatiellia bacterium]